MIPNETLVEFAKGNIDWGNDSFEALLLKNTTEYSPDKDNHNFVSDVVDGTTAEEFDGTGYTAGFGNSGRLSLTTTTVSVDDTDDEAELDCDDITWTSLGSSSGGQTVEAVLVYKVGTSDSDSRIIRVYDDSEEADLEKQTNGEDFTWQINSEGVLNITNT